jgi:hypothetical protein
MQPPATETLGNSSPEERLRAGATGPEKGERRVWHYRTLIGQVVLRGVFDGRQRNDL